MTLSELAAQNELKLVKGYWSALEDLRNNLEGSDEHIVVMLNGIGIDSDLLIDLLYTQEMRYKEKVERLTKEVNHV